MDGSRDGPRKPLGLAVIAILFIEYEISAIESYEMVFQLSSNLRFKRTWLNPEWKMDYAIMVVENEECYPVATNSKLSHFYQVP